MRSNHKREKELFVWAIALSLGILAQLPLIAFIVYTPDKDGDDVKNGFASSVRPLVLVPPPIKKEKEAKGQVVNLPEPEKEETPPLDTRYLAQHDHKVKKEQKARFRSDKKPVPSKKRADRSSKLQSEDSQSKKVTRIPKEREKSASSTQSPAVAKSGEFANEVVQKDNPGGIVFPKIPASFGKYRVQTLTSRGSADDAILDVQEQGDDTLLNARKFRFWAFFQRVKDQVRPHWTPNEALLRRDPTGRAYCCSDRLSVLHVVLDRNGRLVEVETNRSSGLKFLDRVAQMAFRRAEPFPNPPDELMEDDRLEFEFGFLLEFRNGMPLMKWVPPQHL